MMHRARTSSTTSSCALHAGVMAAAITAAGAASAQPASSAAPAASSASTLGFSRGPYLQALGVTGVTVKFELSAPSTAKVEVFAAGSTTPIVSQASAEARRFHAVRVDGLTAATAYDYRVTAGGAQSDAGRFNTAPSGDKAFRFLIYGDSRSDAETHAAIVRAMASVPADFLVNSGDLVHAGNDERAWQSFFAVEGPLLRDRCVFAAVGNHELAHGDPAGEVAFLKYFAMFEDGREQRRLYGSFRWANARFFVLNAMDNWTGEEREWLRAELDGALVEPGLAHRIALMHWGPYSSGPHGGNPALASGEVITMMRDRKVDLVIAGHDHIYERGVGQGLKYVISGGAGAPLYPRRSSAPETLSYESAYHFIEAAVDGEQVELTVRRPSGGIIETCGFRGMGSWDCASINAATPTGSTTATPGRAASDVAPASSTRSGCGCSVPDGRGGAGGGAAVLAVAALVGRRRRRG